MEDALSSLWNNLSISEQENTTIDINSSKLFAPSNALIGRLAMKKYVSTLELEKGLRIIWEVTGAMDMTQLGANLFMFEFKER